MVQTDPAGVGTCQTIPGTGGFPHLEFDALQEWGPPAALDFDVVPKKVGAASSPAPHAGHHFMMIDAFILCSLVAVP